MKSRVSVRGQTVIPAEIRRALGITPDTAVHWRVESGTLVGVVVPADPVKASLGVLKGKVSSDDLRRERTEERARERTRENGAN
ncbi:MAG: AbrB/MazE/SpoVT family DNA-binding domain-containing protein [Chloroflexi bacterium]|nr:AbrB/MazE/SpoVT family DNA-binding domain-containing protein [Chloroflexota bacterium]MBI4338459.1 AbrB/MazE/SpoVT family DNA-binding domain-containing protein [Chloroflexota bacterium]